MGWRFRKIVRFGPVRGWVARSGIGYSWGFPGFRVGISANGTRYLSVGIPGTGLYFIKHFTRSRTKSLPPITTNGQRGVTAPQIPSSGAPAPGGPPGAPQLKQPPWWRQKNLP